MQPYLGHYVIKFTYGTTFNDFNREKYVNRSNNRCILCIYGGVVVCKKIMSFTQYFAYKSARVCCCFYIVNKMQRAHSIVMSWNTLFNLCKMYFLRNVIGNIMDKSIQKQIKFASFKIRIPGSLSVVAGQGAEQKKNEKCVLAAIIFNQCKKKLTQFSPILLHLANYNVGRYL